MIIEHYHVLESDLAFSSFPRVLFRLSLLL